MDGCNKRQYRPTVDETPVPCDRYYNTDCIYPGDEARVEFLNITQGCNMTDVINALVEALKKRDDRINELERRLNKLL